MTSLPLVIMTRHTKKQPFKSGTLQNYYDTGIDDPLVRWNTYARATPGEGAGGERAGASRGEKVSSRISHPIITHGPRWNLGTYVFH